MNLLKTVALLGFLSALLVLIGYYVFGGVLGALAGLAIAAVGNFAVWYYSDQIALAIYGARPANRQEAERLKPMVETLCYRAHLPVPKIYVVPIDAANAFATGRDPEHAAVAVTRGLMDLLNEEELEAVVAHELSHIQHRDTLTQTVASTLAGAIALLAQISGHGLWSFGGRRGRLNPFNPVGLLLTVALAPGAAAVIQMAISRTREFAADAGAARLTGSPKALANALERLENRAERQPMPGNTAFAPLLIINPFSDEFLSRLFSTHPPTAARVEQLVNLEPGSPRRFDAMNRSKAPFVPRHLVSVLIILVALGLAYAPLPGLQKTLVVVSGTELQESLQQLETQFEQQNPNIKLELKFQGSQDIVNNYIDAKGDFKPAVVIPANAEILTELETRWRAQNQSDPFYEAPRPIAKTLLVGVAWPERGKVLFPDGRFRWQRVEQGMQAGNWAALGGPEAWGSFDFVITDPTRSNSGQLALGLLAQSKLGGSLDATGLGRPELQALFGLVKRSVYQPPRSTDTLLQEFIARGPNDADVAVVYESIALHRWQQAGTSQGKPYQIYYLDPSVETVSTAAIVRREVDAGTAQAARKFLDFLTEPTQQAVFVQNGFRPVLNSVDVQSVPNSPWTQNIPGAEPQPAGQFIPAPNPQTLSEIGRLWERAN